MSMLTDGGWFDWFIASLWFPLVAGLLIQVTAVQPLKFLLPARLSDRRRRLWIWVMAFLAGLIPTASIMAGMGRPAHELWLAAVVGFAGPMLYRAATALIYSKWPQLEGTLSAHHKAVRKTWGSRQ